MFALLSKQTRLPFGLNSISTREPFELIHCDIWGDLRVPSLSSAYYFFTLVDDFSRHKGVYLIQFKSETLNLLKSFFALVITHFNRKVGRFQVDN